MEIYKFSINSRINFYCTERLPKITGLYLKLRNCHYINNTCDVFVQYMRCNKWSLYSAKIFMINFICKYNHLHVHVCNLCINHTYRYEVIKTDKPCSVYDKQPNLLQLTKDTVFKILIKVFMVHDLLRCFNCEGFLPLQIFYIYGIPSGRGPCRNYCGISIHSARDSEKGQQECSKIKYLNATTPPAILFIIYNTMLKTKALSIV